MTEFTYKWELSDLDAVPKNGLKVFSCFACGGGSTMGYKMSGFDVIGANEIDPQMAAIYKQNHNPKYLYVEDIRKFRERDNLPEELYNLDILDGSPPCSSFSMAGRREKQWGKKKKFREGQASQVLDDLFFEFIQLAHKLQPKVVIAENVKGMLQGNAKGYVKQVINLFKVSGYDVQLFLLNGATMGLPQRRGRVFFIANRIGVSALSLKFNEKQISIKEAITDIYGEVGKDMSHSVNYKYWAATKPGNPLSSAHPKGSLFNSKKLDPNRSAPTIVSGSTEFLYRWDKMATLSTRQLQRLQSFPEDYKADNALLRYQIGMSVPPLMMHKISREVYRQWFKNDAGGSGY